MSNKTNISWAQSWNSTFVNTTVGDPFDYTLDDYCEYSKINTSFDEYLVISALSTFYFILFSISCCKCNANVDCKAFICGEDIQKLWNLFVLLGYIIILLLFYFGFGESCETLDENSNNQHWYYLWISTKEMLRHFNNYEWWFIITYALVLLFGFHAEFRLKNREKKLYKANKKYLSKNKCFKLALYFNFKIVSFALTTIQRPLYQLATVYCDPIYQIEDRLASEMDTYDDDDFNYTYLSNDSYDYTSTSTSTMTTTGLTTSGLFATTNTNKSMSGSNNGTMMGGGSIGVGNGSDFSTSGGGDDEYFIEDSYVFDLIDEGLCKNTSMSTFGFRTNTDDFYTTKKADLLTVGVILYSLFALLAIEFLPKLGVLRYKKGDCCQCLLLTKFSWLLWIICIMPLLILRFYVFFDDLSLYVKTPSLEPLEVEIVNWVDMIFNPALVVVFQWIINQLLMCLCPVLDMMNNKQKYKQQKDNNVLEQHEPQAEMSNMRRRSNQYDPLDRSKGRRGR